MITKGISNSFFYIPSYKKIESESGKLTIALANYNKLNKESYETSVNNLNLAIKSYKTSKSKYEKIVEELAEFLNKNNKTEEEILEEVIYSDKEKYKVDFLLITLGQYGEQEGVDVVYQLTTSSTVDPNSTKLNYFLSDLKFTVTGKYMDVTNFISDLENDDKLGWEITGFRMQSGTANGYSGVSAQFTIKDVPIDSESYLLSNSDNSQSNSEGNQLNNQNSSGTITSLDSTQNIDNGNLNQNSNTADSTATVSSNNGKYEF